MQKKETRNFDLEIQYMYFHQIEHVEFIYAATAKFLFPPYAVIRRFLFKWIVGMMNKFIITILPGLYVVKV